MSLGSVGLLESIWPSMESSDGHGCAMTCMICFFPECGTLMYFLYFQMPKSESDNSSDDGDQFFNIITKGAKLAGIYCDLYLHKAPPRVSIQTGIGWIQ